VQRGTARPRRQIAGWLSVVAGSLILLYVSAKTLVWAGALIAGFF
jgi:hypothetical protein